MPELKEALQQRAKLIKEARDILDKADVEKRTVDSEERTKYDNLEKVIDSLTTQIDIEKRQLERENLVKTHEPSTLSEPEKETSIEKRKKVFRNYIVNGEKGVSHEDRSLIVSDDTKGGYIVTPEYFINGFLKELDNEIFMRSLSTIHYIPAPGSAGIPTLENDVEDADWTSEIKTGKKAKDLSFGKRKLETNKLAKRIKVSQELLSHSGTFNAESIINTRLRYKFSIAEENAYMVGDGNKKPLGIFMKSDSGISSDRDIEGGLTFDKLIDLQHHIKEGYRKNANFILNDTVLKEIRKIKDKENRYIWQPSTQIGKPDTILGKTYFTSEYAPKLKQNDYCLLFGDLKYYWILDTKTFEIKKLEELYAEEDKVGFIAKKYTDGMPIMASAFARLTYKKS